MKSILSFVGAVLVTALITNGYAPVEPKTLDGRVIVSWDPNTEADLAGYRVYYGLASRSYSDSINVGNVILQQISGLETNQRWYFAVTAYDTANNESGYSEEVSIYLDGNGDSTIVTVHLNYYNFPNPFNPDRDWTNIRYYLKNPEQVSIKIYDAKENFVRELFRDEARQPGEHFEPWDGRDRHGRVVRNGVYLAVLMIGRVKRIVQIGVVR